MKKLIVLVIIFASTLFGSPAVSFAATGAPAVTQSGEAVDASQSETSEAVKDEHAEEVDPGVVGMFGINWKLFLAQLINFGIVLFVLWKWVWKPVTSNMEERTRKIEESLANADQITKEKEEFTVWKETEMSKARQEATAIISEAKTQAEALKIETLEKTKQEQQTILERSARELEQQKQQAISSAKSELAELVISAAEKLIRNKVDKKADQKLISQAVKELE